MMLILALILVTSLKTAEANEEPVVDVPVETPEKIEKLDMCVGCNDKKEEIQPESKIEIEILIDPLTGNVLYVIKGLTVE